MRSFFGRLGASKDAASSSDQGRSPRIGGASPFSWFGRRGSQVQGGDVLVNETQQEADIEGTMIRSAAHTLSDAIETILGNNESLSGSNMKGFIALMRVLECADTEIHTTDLTRTLLEDDDDDNSNTPTKLDKYTSHSGEGCIQILLDNTNHPDFTEACATYHLVVSLVHAMRLLKVFEVKMTKRKEQDAVGGDQKPSSKSMPGNDGSRPHSGSHVAERIKAQEVRDMEKFLKPGASKLSSQRVCTLLGVLCAEPATLELLHSSKILEKLLTYPISAFPEKALHLQKDIAAVLSKMCSRPLPSDQVWLLHDLNAIPLMTRSLKELCAHAEETQLITKSNGDLRVSAAGSSMEKAVPAVRRGSGNSLDVRTDQIADEWAESSEPGMRDTLTSSLVGEDWPSLEENMHTSTGIQRNQILRGLAAERAEMWVLATNALVDVVCASMSVSPVLMNDFEYAGGYKLMVHILQHSSQKNCTHTLLAVTRLFADPFKGPEEVISFPTVGAIILEVLVSVLHLKEVAEASDAGDIHKFVRIAHGIVVAQRDGTLARGWEVLVQNIAYALLTLYSNQTLNCITLEGSYQYLSILVLCVPALSCADSISAILTTLNFVCHSVEEVVRMPLIALCASTGVCLNLCLHGQDASLASLQSLPSAPMPTGMNYSHSARVVSQEARPVADIAKTSAEIVDKETVQQCLDEKNVDGYKQSGDTVSRAIEESRYRDTIMSSLESMLQSFDSIAIIRGKYALQILRSGFLQSIVCPLFENLCMFFNQENSLLKSKEGVSAESQKRIPSISEDGAAVYTKVIDLLLHLIARSPHAAEEVRQSGLNVIFRNLIRADQASMKLASHFLRLPETLSTCQTTHLEESIQTIFDVLQQLNTIHAACADTSNIEYISNTCAKVQVLFNSLYTVLECAEDAVWVWIKFKGFQVVVDTIVSMRHFFSSGNAAIIKLACDALESAFECLALELNLVECLEEERKVDARFKALRIGDALQQANVFSSASAMQCVNLIINLMCGFGAAIKAAEKENSTASISCPEMTLLILKILPLLSDQQALIALQSIEKHAVARYDGYQVLAEAGFVYYALEQHAPMIRGDESLESSRTEVAAYLRQMIRNIVCAYLTVSDFYMILQQIVRPGLVHVGEESKLEGQFKLLAPHKAHRLAEQDKGLDSLKLLMDLAFQFTKPVTAHTSPFVTLGYGASSVGELAHVDVLIPDTNRILSSGSMTFSCWIRCQDSSACVKKTDDNQDYPLPPNPATPRVATPGNSLNKKTSSSSPPPPISPVPARHLSNAQEHTSSKSTQGPFIPVATFCAQDLDYRGCYLEVVLNVLSHRVVVYCRGANWHKALLFQAKNKIASQEWLHIALVVKKAKRFGLGTGKYLIQVFLNGEECENMAPPSDINGSHVDLNIPAAPKDGPLATHLYIGKSLVAITSIERSFRSFIEHNGDMLPNCASEYVSRWQLGPVLLYDTALVHAQLAYMFISGPNFCGVQASSGTHDSPMTENLTSLCSDLLSRCSGPNSNDIPFFNSMGFDGLEHVVDPLVEKSAFSVLSVPVPLLPSAVLEYNARNSICRHTTPKFVDPVSTRTRLLSMSEEGQGHRPRNRSRASSQEAATSHSSGSGNHGHGSSFSGNRLAVLDIADGKYERQSKLNSAQATKIALLNAASIDNGLPIASCVHGWHKGNPESFASCVSALGGPSIMFPILQVATTEDAICQALLLLRLCLVRCPANLKRMQEEGYKMMAFIIARKPRNLMTPRIINLLFLFATNEDISKYRNIMYSRQEMRVNADSTLSIISSGAANTDLLLVDTVSLFQLYLNHHVWGVATFDIAMRVLSNLADLVDDRHYGTINSHRLSALGAARWVILLAAYGSDRSDRNSDTSSFSLAIDESMEVLLDQVKSLSSPVRSTRWTMQRVELQTTSNECEAGEPFLAKAVLSVLKNVMRVELRKRDIEMVGMLILYTFIPARPTYVEETDGSGRENLSTFALLRVYLMRLLFTLFEEGTDDPLYKPSGDPHRRSRSPSLLLRDVASTFRSVFTPDWFLGILEKVSDLPTFSEALRLLSLFIQKDAVFRAEFAAAQGLRSIRTILICRPQELCVMLPLLALFFQVPMHLVPYANQVKVVDRMTRLLELEEAKGPELNDTDLVELYSPLFKLIVDCVTINAHFVQESTDIAAVQHYSYVTVLILSTLNHGFDHTKTFKEFMQERSVLAALIATALGCSTGMDDFGTYATVMYENNGADLESVIEEDYIPQISNYTETNIASPTRPRAVSRIRYIADLQGPPVPTKDLSRAEQTVSLIGTQGELLRSMIYNCVESALADVNHSAIMASLLLSLPAHVVGSYLTGCQSMLIDIMTNAVKDALDKGNADMTFCTNLANALTLLIPLSKADIFHDTSIQLKIFKLSVFCLDKMMNYFPTLQTGGRSGIRMSPQGSSSKMPNNVFQMLEPLIKNFGATARYFAIRCIHGLISNVDIARDDHNSVVRHEVLSSIRQNMAMLLANTFEDSVEPLLEALPTPKKGMFGFTSNVADEEGRSAGGPLGFGLWRSKDRELLLQQQQQIVTGPAPLAKHSHFNRDSVTAALSAAVLEKLKWSQVFCAKMIAASHSLFLDDNNECRIESARIFALVVFHKRHLMENLFFSPMKVLLTTERDPGLALTPRNNEFFREGMELVAPIDGMQGHYELFLKGHTQDNVGEEHRMAAFTFWLTENEARCVDLFEGIERALVIYIDKTSGDTHELWQKHINSLKHPAKGVIDDINDFNESRVLEMSMRRAEDLLRKGEQVIGSVRRWRVHGLSLAGGGAMAWHHHWSAVQAGPIWGYKSISSQQVSNSFTKVWRISAAEGPERTRRHLEQDFSTSAQGLLYFPLDDVYSPKGASLSQTAMILSPTRRKSFTPPRTNKNDVVSYDSPEVPIVESPSSTLSTPSTNNSEPRSTVSSAQKFQMLTTAGGRNDEELNEDQDMLLFMKRMNVSTFIKKVRGANVNLQDFVINEADTESGVVSTTEKFRSISVEDIPDVRASPNVKFGTGDNNLHVGKSLGSKSIEPVNISTLSNAARKGDLHVSEAHAIAENNEGALPDAAPTMHLSNKPYVETETPYLPADVGHDNGGSLINRSDSTYSLSSDGSTTGEAKDLDEIVRSETPQIVASVKAEVGEEVQTRPETVEPVRQKASNRPDSIRRETLKASRVDGNRTLAIQELVRGLIGSNEWDAKSTIFYNVQKIVGLELQRAVVVFTSVNLHVLGGFRAVDKTRTRGVAGIDDLDDAYVKGVDCILEWVGLTPAAAEGSLKAFEDTVKRSRNKRHSSGTDADTPSTPRRKVENNEEIWLNKIWSIMLGYDAGYLVMPLQEIYSIFKRRHHLKYTALEITDTAGVSILFACASQDAMNKLLVSMLEAELPSSIFRLTLGAKNMQLLRGASHMYNRLMATFLSSITQMWVSGQISNFEYLMHLNAAAGRSFLDLTQYPIFPWVLADYSSDKLNLYDAATFRDLSKPMGALGEKRAAQFRDRYASLKDISHYSGSEGFETASNSDSGAESTPTPPFFYGTHYSCAGYVLHYLNRLQPYADMSIALQGGRFDNPDRLFIDIASSWTSASAENLQDVRELIPEFYYCPEFLINANKFNFGCTQKDVLVQDVVLPRWAHGDPHEFVKKHREALESKYVSENLHNWIDLIFGYKQRGEAAEESMNVFIHLTYEGEVDVDAITDPLLRSATISQINNFGQCPSKLFSKRHPARIIPEIFKKVVQSATITPKSMLAPTEVYSTNVFGTDEVPIDFTEESAAVVTDAVALSWHEHISPPLCVVGANHIIDLVKVGKTEQFTRPDISSDRVAIADIHFYKGTITAVNRGGLLLPQAVYGKKVIRFGGPGCGFTLLANASVASNITNTAANINSATLVTTGSLSSMVTGMAITPQNQGTRYNSVVSDHDREVYSAHERLHEGTITCMTCSRNGMVLFTGSKDCSVRMWSAQQLLSHRRIERMFTFVGHSATITCLDYCVEFHTLVSGCERGRACMWDSRTGRLLRILQDECADADPVLCVSMSSTSGMVAVLSRSVLSVYAINGQLLARQLLTHGRTAGKDVDSDGQVVLAVSTADWQDGVACVTGHASGSVYLWKMKSAFTKGDAEVSDERGRRIMSKLPATTSTGISTTGTCAGVKRSLYIAHTLPRTHSQCITSLRIISSTVTSITQTVIGSRKDFINRAHTDAGSMELFVGDAGGFVSRWSAAKLDTLMQNDRISLAGLPLGGL